jgi:hypothetical protein
MDDPHRLTMWVIHTQSAMLKRVDHLPGFSALAPDVVEEKKCFSELVVLP